MVSDTRSGRHFKDEYSSNLKKTPSIGKDLSPHCSQKSRCLEKGMPPSTPVVKRKSERPKKQRTKSPARMSERGNKNASFSSCGSQQSAKELGFSGKREKDSCQQPTTESEKAKLDVDSHVMNGNKINARSFKALLKRQRVMEIVPDVDGRELGEPNISSHVCADNPDRNGVKDSKKSFNASERLPGKHLSINMDAPEPECTTSLDISQVGAINSKSDENFMGPKVLESIPSSSTKCDKQGLLGTCVLCSKMKRVKRYSPNQELCSCSDVVNKDRVSNLSTREDRLSHFVSNKSTSEASKFLEYWVPSQISNFQLELYCSSLLSNSTPLRSCSRNDSVGALQDILLDVRKCCDHPYLVDSSLQERMIAEKCPATELLDVGIKACGKLQLLDAMLTESMTRGLKTLILHQWIRGFGGASIGDILDDFLRQKFGPNTYERVDARVSHHKKQAAINRFNKNETGQFAFLLENRACSSTIKLLAVDVIVLYDSDWNPANDIRALQKISIDSKAEQIKVFRLYSSCTIEERALVLAKKNLKLDNNLRTFSRTTVDSLLMWGASYLFNQLDDYHAYSNNAALSISSGQSVLNEVNRVFQAILSDSSKNIDLGVMSKVWLSAENYSMNIPLLGEEKNHLKDGEKPYIFWKNLLDRNVPLWRNIRGPCPRNRKKVQHTNASPDTVNDNVAKRHKRVIHENSNPASVQSELGEHQVTQAACPEGGGSSTIFACDKSQSFWTESVAPDSYPDCIYGQSTHGPAVDMGDPEDRGVLFDDQKNVYGFLEGETIKLCQILKLSEVVMDMVRRFLKYVIKNHQVSTDSPAYVQALQISLCWIAASLLKHKVDKKDSLMLAKQLRDYQCTEEQVTSVYSKLRTLMRTYLHCSENFTESGNLSSNVDEHTESQIPMSKKMAMDDKVAESEIENKAGNDVAPSVPSISIPSEALCCSTPIESLIDSADSNTPSEKCVWSLDRLSLAVVEKPNQSKHPNDADEIVSMDLLPAWRQQVSDEIQPVEMNGEVSKVVPEHVPNGAVGCFTPLKLATTPDKEFDNVEAVCLVDAMENPRNRPDEVIAGALPFPEQQLVRSEQIAASPDRCDFFPQQVSGEQIPQNLESAELQPENQSKSQIEVSTPQLFRAVIPHQPNHGASETENHEQLHFVSDATLSGSQFPTIEVEHQNHARGGSSFHTAEAVESEVLLNEPSFESLENSELRRNQLDPCPGARVQELPNHPALHLEMNAGQLHGPSHLQAHYTQPVTTWNSTPALSVEPLQIELERMQKESEQLERSYEDVISQLKSECEMEIQEIITKIRNDYDMNLKDNEVEYMLKKNELGKNQALVLMNKMLAEAFRSKCLDLRPSGLLGMQVAGTPESLRQHLQSASTLNSTTPATEVMQAMRQLSLPESTRPSPTVSLNSMVPPVQRAPALYSSTPSRPPLIGAITHSGNPHTGGQNRSMAPHLQLFRPPIDSSVPLAIPQPPPIRILNSQPSPLLQQMQTNPVSQPLPPSSQQMQANIVSPVRPDSEILTPTSNVDVSALELPTFMNNQAPHVGILNSQPPLLSVQQMQTNPISQARPDPQIVVPTQNQDLSAPELPIFLKNQAPPIPTNHILPSLHDVLTSDLAASESVVCLSDDE